MNKSIRNYCGCISLTDVSAKVCVQIYYHNIYNAELGKFTEVEHHTIAKAAGTIDTADSKPQR
jgi:hypothetical protein